MAGRTHETYSRVTLGVRSALDASRRAEDILNAQCENETTGFARSAKRLWCMRRVARRQPAVASKTMMINPNSR